MLPTNLPNVTHVAWTLFSPLSPPPPLTIHQSELWHFIEQLPELKQIQSQLLKVPLSHHHHHHHLHPSTSFFFNRLLRSLSLHPHHKHLSLPLYSLFLSHPLAFPNNFTFPSLLKSQAFVFADTEGLQLHSHIVKLGLASDTYISNSLIHFYASCGLLGQARQVFDRMPLRTQVSWNVVIDGYSHWGQFETAVALFRAMQANQFSPDGFTVQSLLGACSGLGTFCLGIWAHAFILKRCGREVAEDVLVNNSLVDMYMKCGAVDMARQVFCGMASRDVASWNALILGLAMHGRVEEVLDMFVDMGDRGGLKPNSITFVGVLSACNHAGLVSEAWRYFDMMVAEYEIEPQIEHYGCMVDLLSRAGHIVKALDLVSVMPMKPDAVIWRSLLDSCCKQNAGVDIGEFVAKQALDSTGGVCSGVYVLLSRVYASAERWKDVGLVRSVMSDVGIKKEPGCSSIEIDGIVHEFMAGDTYHPRSKEIYGALEVIDDRLAVVGYAPDVSQAPMIAKASRGKQKSLRLHSERLAIAFGLLNVKQGMPIRILKNLRVCNDCHSVTKLISRIFNVEIIVRDRIRFHRFKDGSCSCRDYW